VTQLLEISDITKNAGQLIIQGVNNCMYSSRRRNVDRHASAGKRFCDLDLELM